MQTILLTGNKGTIGTIVTSYLSSYNFKLASRPEVDVTNYTQLKDAMKGCDTVVHLAWHMKDDWDENKIYAYNNLMTQNVYEAALGNKVKKIIMASSVHADNFYSWTTENGYLSTKRNPNPQTLYGKSKVYEENLGKVYAQNGLEVICIRLGGINKENIQPTNDKYEAKVWLSHKDFSDLLKKCIDAKTISGRFSCLYAVSDNVGRIHDVSNPFKWNPK